jgi:hypothetical protein
MNKMSFSEFLKGLTKWVTRVLFILWIFRVVVISLLVLYLVLWKVDQGQDLLVNLNDEHLGIILFYISITILAALHWHVPKYFWPSNFPSNVNLRELLGSLLTGQVLYKGDVEISERLLFNISRMLGITTILISAFAVWNVLHSYGIDNSGFQMWGLLLAISFYGIVFYKNIIERIYDSSAKAKVWMHGLMIALLLIIAAFGAFNNKHPGNLWLLFTGLILLSLVFAIAVSIRRKMASDLKPNDDTVSLVAKYYRALNNRNAARWVMGPVLVLVVIFIALNFWPHLLMSVTVIKAVQKGSPTLFVLICSLVFYVFLFTILILWGKSTKINIAAIVILVLIGFSFFTSNSLHKIRTLGDADSKPDRALLKDHFKNWLEAREISSDSGKYPIFLVNAYGGGVRAAAWTALVMNRLDEITFDSTAGKKTFQDHVFAYSSASGGTFGALTLCASRKENSKPIDNASLKKFLLSDFLSPTIIGVTGRDIGLSVFGKLLDWVKLPMRDRAALQEITWEKEYNRCFHSDLLRKDFSKIWEGDDQKKIPLLLANTYQLDSGLKAIVSPVKLPSQSFPSTIMMYELANGKGLRASTSALLSGRFPLIYPAGELRKNHFMDGGLKENSGAETASELYSYLDSLLNTPEFKDYRSLVEFNVLSLPNTAIADWSAKEKKSKKKFNYPLAPLTALRKNWEGNSLKADSLNRVRFSDNYFSIRPDTAKVKDEYGVEYKAVLPLGWQLSDQAVNRMTQSIERQELYFRKVVSKVLK